MKTKKKPQPKPRNREPGAAPGLERPWRRVKFQNENPFIRRLIKRYGDLPVDQLVARWKKEAAK